jgi:ribosomal protein S18 acetylase RimI-like enzyme
MISGDLKTIFEQQEAACWKDHYLTAPRQSIEDLSLGCRKVGRAVAVCLGKVDILAFNRVIGLGVESPVLTRQLDEMISFYKKAGVKRFFVQLSPYATPEHAVQMLKDKGFRFHNNWVKFYRTLKVIPAVPSHPDIKRIGRDDAAYFADIIIKSFQWPEILKPVISGPVGRPGWKHYLAYQGNKPVACAALFIRDIYATLAFAATQEEFQGQGVQSSLIARRFEDAREAGCHFIFTETAEETPERSVASYRNMNRHGFTVAYLRPNYIYDFDKV